MLTPLPPSGIDIVQKLLLRDHYVCYYDPKARRPPTTRASYLVVVYTDNERLDFDRRLAVGGIRRDIAVAVPSFNGVPAFLKGSRTLASMPSMLASHPMRDFAGVRIPLAARARGMAELPMYMVWHRRHQKGTAGEAAATHQSPRAAREKARTRRADSIARGD